MTRFTVDLTVPGVIDAETGQIAEFTQGATAEEVCERLSSGRDDIHGYFWVDQEPADVPRGRTFMAPEEIDAEFGSSDGTYKAGRES